MNSVLTMTQRKNPNLTGASGNGHDSHGHGAMINALRKLYDPVLEEPVPDFLIRIASMTRDEAEKDLAKREGDTKADSAAKAGKSEGDEQP
jgi:hypothetical protein